MAQEDSAPSKKQRAHVFAWLHAVLAQSNDLQNRAHALAAALVIHANADGSRCFPSLPHLREHTNQSTATIYRAKDDLVAAGLLAESRDEGGRRIWELVVPEDAVTSCRKVLTREKTDSHPREEAVLTHENVPAHELPAHEPAQDLADARSSGEPESPVPEIAQYDHDEAAIEAHVGGFHDDGERLCAADMLQRDEPRKFIVNTILKRRRVRPADDEWHSDAQEVDHGEVMGEVAVMFKVPA